MMRYISTLSAELDQAFPCRIRVSNEVELMILSFPAPQLITDPLQDVKKRIFFVAGEYDTFSVVILVK
jgi:hypothetical protein